MAEGDLETARIAVAGGATGASVVMLLQQAVEKYLKGYLIFRGWKLQKIHNLQVLIEYAADYDPSFADFMELGRVLTGAYFGDRYPPLRPQALSKEEAADALQECEKLIQKIKYAFGGG